MYYGSKILVPNQYFTIGKTQQEIYIHSDDWNIIFLLLFQVAIISTNGQLTNTTTNSANYTPATTPMTSSTSFSVSGQ